MSGTVKRLQNANSSKQFNSLEFDRKVSKSIAKNHNSEKIFDMNYEIWCENNQTHLDNMCTLSGLEVDFNLFCNYIYKNSEK